MELYIKCVSIGLSYNLAFFEAKLHCIQKKCCDKISVMMDTFFYATEIGSYAAKAIAYATHLKIKVKGLEKEKEKFIYYKLQNIKELEYNE